MPDLFDAALIDTGGTLWPESLNDKQGGRLVQLARLELALYGVPESVVEEVYERLIGVVEYQLRSNLRFAIDDVIRGHLEESGLFAAQRRIDRVRTAMSQPTAKPGDLFAGAKDLLQTAQSLDLITVIVTNAVWRTRDDFRDDFNALGVGHLIDHVISSVDIGYRKPHTGLFTSAAALAGCDPDRCIVIGNSEVDDIAPALGLGMTTIRVAIEEPPPTDSKADYVVDSLDAAAETLRKLLAVLTNPTNKEEWDDFVNWACRPDVRADPDLRAALSGVPAGSKATVGARLVLALQEHRSLLTSDSVKRGTRISGQSRAWQVADDKLTVVYEWRHRR